MRIIPLAAESLGTRATCVLVQTEDRVILFDPSVSLGPKRYGLPPHIQEISSAYLSRQLILKAIKHSSIIIQSHYHGDHFSLAIKRPYEFTNRKTFNHVYDNPRNIILAKDMKKNINKNQKKRANWLWKLKNIQLISADGKSFKFGKTELVFSNSLPHGFIKGSWVISVLITDSKNSLLITSDVNGPSSNAALDFILNSEAKKVILDGPSTYFSNQPDEQINQAFERISKIVDAKKELILDHHFLRDVNWRNILIMRGLLNSTKTLADLVQIKPCCLESQRRNLYEINPLKQDFHKLFMSNDLQTLKMIDILSKRLPLHKLKNKIDSLKTRKTSN